MEHHDPLAIVGTTVGEKYEIEAVVGEGGFGIVYRAQHKIWKQPVAIKCFKALMEVAPAVRENLLKDFIQEGALLTQLSGRTASIVQARDVGTFTTPSGQWVPYMVLEWLDGKTLEAMLDADRGRLGRVGGAAWEVEKVIALLEPVAQALDVVHRRAIAHRDIKPANIFVIGEGTDEMHVKVLDFGIAKVVASAAEHGSFTKTGGQVTSFTPAYGAPEQFSRSQGATGAWTDVYALALVMTELLIGRPPLEGDDFIQLGMATADPHRRPTPGGFGVDLGPLEAVFQKALAVRPQDRYGTAGEFWQAVRASQNMPDMRASNNTSPRSWVSPSGSVRGDTAGQPPASREASTAATELAPGASSRTSPVAGPSTRDPVATSTATPPSRSKGGVVAGALAFAAVASLGGFFMMGQGKKGDAGKGSAVVASGLASSVAGPVMAPAPAPKGCAGKMAKLDGGKFFMGSDDKDERPAHQVTLSPYCIDLYEVTTAEYKACSDVGECKRAPAEVEWKDLRPAEKKAFSPLCNAGQSERSKHPINCVDWDMAASYCAWVKKRLPTEAEWEFAARGPDGRRYPWGDEAPDKTRMNACGKECVSWGAKNGVEMGFRGKGMYPDDDGFVGTAPVGSFGEGNSRYGLFDVVGNVWEWTSDWEGNYAGDPQVDPTGPKLGERRVVRGGAFNGAVSSWLRPSQRYSDLPATHSHAYGFRCASSQ